MTRGTSLLALAVVAAAAIGGCFQSSTPYGLGPGATGDGDDGDGDTGDTSDSGGPSGPGGPGGPGGGTGSGAGARGYFDANVLPMLGDYCSSCHSSALTDPGPDFLGASKDVYYASLELVGYITMPDNSMLLLKGEHTGPALTGPQAATVTSWLDLEVEERGLTGGGTGGGSGQPPPSLTLQEALEQFAACMSLGDWENVGMDGVANQNTTEGPCKSCHQTGTGGAFLSDGSNETFQMSHQMPYILKLVLGTVNADGSFKDLVPADRFVDKGGEGGLHPKYIMTPERQLAIAAFFDLTYDKWKAGPCTP